MKTIMTETKVWYQRLMQVRLMFYAALNILIVSDRTTPPTYSEKKFHRFETFRMEMLSHLYNIIQMPFFSIILSSYHFVMCLLCKLSILSSVICQPDNLSCIHFINCHFVHKSFCYLVIMSTGHFVN